MAATTAAGALSNWSRTSDGWKQDAEKHQEAVGAAHVCDWYPELQVVTMSGGVRASVEYRDRRTKDVDRSVA